MDTGPFPGGGARGLALPPATNCQAFSLKISADAHERVPLFAQRSRDRGRQTNLLARPYPLRMTHPDPSSQLENLTRVLDAIDLAESTEAIREALAQIDRGEGREARDVIASIRRDLGLTSPRAE